MLAWTAPHGAAHTASWVETAKRLLDAIADLEDRQVGLRLLRRAAGHARMTHRIRCAARMAHGIALQNFDARVRKLFRVVDRTPPGCCPVGVSLQIVQGASKRPGS